MCATQPLETEVRIQCVLWTSVVIALQRKTFSEVRTRVLAGGVVFSLMAQGLASVSGAHTGLTVTWKSYKLGIVFDTWFPLEITVWEYLHFLKKSDPKNPTFMRMLHLNF